MRRQRSSSTRPSGALLVSMTRSPPSADPREGEAAWRRSGRGSSSAAAPTNSTPSLLSSTLTLPAGAAGTAHEASEEESHAAALTSRPAKRQASAADCWKFAPVTSTVGSATSGASPARATAGGVRKRNGSAPSAPSAPSGHSRGRIKSETEAGGVRGRHALYEGGGQHVRLSGRRVAKDAPEPGRGFEPGPADAHERASARRGG